MLITKMEILPLLVLVLLNCSSIFGVKLTANLEGTGNRVHFDIGKSLSFSCTTDDDDVKIKWRKGEKLVADAFDDTNHYSIKEDGATSKFRIQYTTPTDDGAYSCEADNESQSFEAYARPIVKVKPHDIAVVDGQRLELKCLAYGSDLVVSWVYPNGTDDRVTYEVHEISPTHKLESGILRIDHVKMSDRGTFKCIAMNGEDEESKVEAEAYVRVKDKYAALWPFIFICVEVFVLCSIILIYEKKRNKTEVDDSETDAAPETKNGKK